MLTKEHIDALKGKLDEVIRELHMAYNLINESSAYKKALLDVAERDIMPHNHSNETWRQSMSAIIDSAYEEGYRDGIEEGEMNTHKSGAL